MLTIRTGSKKNTSFQLHTVEHTEPAAPVSDNECGFVFFLRIATYQESHIALCYFLGC